MARKTTSTEVKNRWKAANYKTYTVNLRIDSDSDLIQYVEQYKASHDGIGITDIFRAGVEALKVQEKSRS